MNALPFALFEKNENTQHGVGVRYVPVHLAIPMNTMNTRFSVKESKEGFTILSLSFFILGSTIQYYCTKLLRVLNSAHSAVVS